MALSNHERVGKALDILKDGLHPFIEREFKSVYRDKVLVEARDRMGEDSKAAGRPINEWDASLLLRLMWASWNDVFGKTLGHAERSLVSELRHVRNKWAHQEPFTSDDADRALDSMTRLLTAISAPQADEVGKMKMELRRLVYEEQVRGEKRKAGGSLVEGAVTGAVRPWRRSSRPIPTWQAAVTSRRSSPPICGRCIWVKAAMNTVIRLNFSVEPSSPKA
jgi:hypothetical protein